MSIRATGPFPIFLDSDGTPLSQGYVYFGVSGSNPETTPQAVYWDEALTIPAAQPLRTLSGFLVRNGSPASVFLANVYSVTVRNKNRVLLYSSLVNVGNPYSTAMVPVMSAATLAAALTAFGFSAYIQTLIDDANAATARTTLGLEALETRATGNVYAAFSTSYDLTLTNAGPITIDISAGASFTNCVLRISQRGAGVTTIQTGAGKTADIGVGSLVLRWNGTDWEKVGGQAIRKVFTSGAGATWKTPWAGSYKLTVVGGGGGGGAVNWAGIASTLGAGGGAGGGAASKCLAALAGVTLTYTIGAGGAGGIVDGGGAHDGSSGADSTVTDGTVTLTGGGGSGGGKVEMSAPTTPNGGGGGLATGGDYNVLGQTGGAGSYVSGATTPYVVGGGGGSSLMGLGGGERNSRTTSNGMAGGAYGGGGSGGVATSTTATGGAGSSGILVMEF